MVKYIIFLKAQRINIWEHLLLKKQSNNFYKSDSATF
jgi:hypothetical protein